MDIRKHVFDCLVRDPTLSGAAIARELQIGDTTAKKYRKEFLGGRRGLPSIPSDYDEYTIAPLPASQQQDGGELFETWRKASDNGFDFEEIVPHDVISFTPEDSGAILIAHLTDHHIGARGVDYTQMKIDAVRIAETEGAYAVVGGDLWDNHVKHVPGIIHSTSTPSQQIAATEYYLDKIKHKIIGMVRGNHDGDWTDNLTGIDPVGILAEKFSIPYSPYQAKILVNLGGGQQVRIDLRHKYRFKSSTNPENQFVKLWEQGDWDWDIAMIGHTHDGPKIGNFYRHGSERWYSLGGTYKVSDGYGEGLGFNPGRGTMSSFVLSGGRILGFSDLTAALGVLKGLRSGSING